VAVHEQRHRQTLLLVPDQYDPDDRGDRQDVIAAYS
jgi:hypothetical protein